MPVYNAKVLGFRTRSQSMLNAGRQPFPT